MDVKFNRDFYIEKSVSILEKILEIQSTRLCLEKYLNRKRDNCFELYLCRGLSGIIIENDLHQR